MKKVKKSNIVVEAPEEYELEETPEIRQRFRGFLIDELESLKAEYQVSIDEIDRVLEELD
jgi:hypothetical protein